MPLDRGYKHSSKGKHWASIEDRRMKPGKVKGERITTDAYGPQKPLGTVNLAKKKMVNLKGTGSYER